MAVSLPITERYDKNTLHWKAFNKLTFTARWSRWYPFHAVAFNWQRRRRRRKKSIDARVTNDGALNCRVTVRHGVLYYRYRSTPVGCTNSYVGYKDSSLDATWTRYEVRMTTLCKLMYLHISLALFVISAQKWRNVMFALPPMNMLYSLLKLCHVLRANLRAKIKIFVLNTPLLPHTK